jgi:hypothetical protein
MVLRLGTSGKQIRITYKIFNAVLEKGGEDHLDRKCEK